MAKPVYKAVTSSNISALAYADGVGWVEFHGGRRFGYQMPKAAFDAIAAAKSIGSHFAREVKGKFAVASTSQRCSNSPCQADASLVGEAGGVPFFVCDACRKGERLAAIVFSPIPPRETKS